MTLAAQHNDLNDTGVYGTISGKHNGDVLLPAADELLHRPEFEKCVALALKSIVVFREEIAFPPTSAVFKRLLEMHQAL